MRRILLALLLLVPALAWGQPATTTVPSSLLTQPLTLASPTISGTSTGTLAGAGMSLNLGTGAATLGTLNLTGTGTALSVTNGASFGTGSSVYANLVGGSSSATIQAQGGSNPELVLKSYGTGGILVFASPSSNGTTIYQNTLNLNPTGTWSGNNLQGNAGLFANSTFTGTGVSNNASALAWLTTNSDGMSIGSAAGDDWEVLHVGDTFGGSTATGNRNALYVTEEITAPTGNNTGTGGAYAAEQLHMNINSRDNGTSGQSRGSFWAMNPVVGLNTGQYIRGLVNQEDDIYAAAGTSVSYKMGLNIALTPQDAVQGTIQDTGLDFQLSPAATSSLGWENPIALGAPNALVPFSAGSTLFDVLPNTIGNGGQSIKATNGIRLTQVDFSGDAYSSPGFAVSGSGSVSVGAGVLAPTTSGISITAPNDYVSAVAPSAGGNNYVVGDIVADGMGGLYEVSSVSAGAVTGISVVVPAYSASPPSNPVTAYNGSGVGLTLNLTWTATGTIALGTSGETTLLGGALQFSSLPTGTPASYACFTSGGQLVSSATAC